MDKVHDRVVKAEASNTTQEREIKDGLQKLLKDVQVRINNFESESDIQRHKQEQKFGNKLDEIRHANYRLEEHVNKKFDELKELLKSSRTKK